MNNNILLTTAISYTNGSPHIGHLYEIILADFIKHLFILKEDNVKLLTGTDEHGKKIEENAKLNLIKPKELCDKYSAEFKNLNDNFKIKYDNFIRTTDEDHIKLVQDSLEKAKDDIYLGSYKGWYSIREETYISELQAKLTNYMDPVSNKPYELVEEESYYFKLSKYKDDLIKYVNELNIQNHTKLELLEKLNDLQDLSISRTSFEWGIQFQNDPKHIVYVWFDALLNYVTGKNRLFSNENIYPIHIIGKDILWFHAVIYPAILMALNLNDLLTKDIIVHGFITDSNGLKMSKSLGNVINVNDLISKCDIEAIRFYFLSNTTSGEDLWFSEDALKLQYSSELINSFGNLFQRIYKLLIPIQNEINQNLDNIEINSDEINNIINTTINNKFDIKYYMNTIKNKLHEINKNLTSEEPWKKPINEKINILTKYVININEIMILLYPVIPDKINELRNYLGLSNIKTNKIKINIENNNIKAFVIKK